MKEIATIRSMVNGTGDKVELSVAQCEGYIRSHGQAVRFVHENIPGRHGFNGAFRGLVARAYRHVDRDTLARFCKVVSTGMADGEHESAAVLLRTFLCGLNAGAGSSKARSMVYHKSEVALLAFVAGRPLVKLQSGKNFIQGRGHKDFYEI